MITWRTQRWPKHEVGMERQGARKGRYTLSVKLSDFTVWFHTWRKNWVNCAVLIGNDASFRTVFPAVFHTQNCAVHSGNPTVSSVYLPTPRWHHIVCIIFNIRFQQLILQISIAWYIPFQIPLLTPQFTSFSSFRITLWPMWLANSKRQPYFYPP